MDIKKYGSMKEELDVQDMIKCREIVKEILDFGVNQRQLLIYRRSLTIPR